MKGICYTPEMINFLRDNALKYNSETLTFLFNKEFNTNIIPQRIRRAMNLRNIKYIKSHKKYPEKPLGSEYINKKKNATYIKISNEGSRQDKWKLKQNFIWEKTHGNIPKYHRVIFLDNNKQNFDINNLECISNMEFILLRKYGFHTSNKDVTKAELAVVRHRLAVLRLMTKGMSERENKNTLNKLYREWRKKKVKND